MTGFMARFAGLFIIAVFVAWPVSRLIGVSFTHAIGWLLVLLIGQWAGLIAHELGHAAAGLARGMTLRQLAIGPVVIDWTRDERHIRSNGLQAPSPGWVNFAGTDHPDRRAVRDHAWVILAGPLGGVLCGLLFIGVAFLGASGWLQVPLVVAGLRNVVESILNLAPIRSGLNASDGTRLRVLMRGGQDAIDLVASVRWQELLHSLEAPGNWAEDVVREQEIALGRPEPLTPAQLDLALMAGYLLYLHYADRREWVEANHVITRAVDLPRPRERTANGRFDMVDVMHAIHLALRGRNPVAARSALARIHRRSVVTRSSSYVGANAAIALAEGNPTAAIDLATLAKNVLAPSLAYSAADQLEASWWDEVIEDAQVCLPVDDHRSPDTPPPLAPSTSFQTLLAVRNEHFAWDPGVPSDLRTVWMWRGPGLAGLDLSA